MVPISGNAPDSLRYECSASLFMLDGQNGRGGGN